MKLFLQSATYTLKRDYITFHSLNAFSWPRKRDCRSKNISHKERPGSLVLLQGQLTLSGEFSGSSGIDIRYLAFIISDRIIRFSESDAVYRYEGFRQILPGLLIQHLCRFNLYFDGIIKGCLFDPEFALYKSPNASLPICFSVSPSKYLLYQPCCLSFC